MSQLFVADAIGAGPFLGIIVVTGTIASLLIDNYGWVAFKVHELNAWRVAGKVPMSLATVRDDLARKFTGEPACPPCTSS